MQYNLEIEQTNLKKKLHSKANNDWRIWSCNFFEFQAESEVVYDSKPETRFEIVRYSKADKISRAK